MDTWVPVVTLRYRGDMWAWAWKTPTSAPLGAPSAFVGVGYETEDEAWRAATASLRSKHWEGIIIGYTEDMT